MFLSFSLRLFTSCIHSFSLLYHNRYFQDDSSEHMKGPRPALAVSSSFTVSKKMYNSFVIISSSLHLIPSPSLPYNKHLHYLLLILSQFSSDLHTQERKFREWYQVNGNSETIERMLPDGIHPSMDMNEAKRKSNEHNFLDPNNKMQI